MYGIDSGNGYVYGEDETVLEAKDGKERKNASPDKDDGEAKDDK